MKSKIINKIINKIIEIEVWKRFLIVVVMYVSLILLLEKYSKFSEVKIYLFSNICIGIIFFTLQAYLGENQSQQASRLGTFLNIYLQREKHVKDNKLILGKSDKKLLNFNNRLEIEYKVLTIYMTDEDFKKSLERYVKDFVATNSDDLIKLIKNKTHII